MTPMAFVIFAGEDAWQIGAAKPQGLVVVDVATGPDDDPAEAAQLAAEALKNEGYTGGGRGVVLAVPSGWCLCASIDTDGLSHQNTRPTMVYRLEEKLPVAAEDLIADFIPHNGQSLGVCIESSKILPIIEALEKRGVAVDVVSPTALLALQDRLSAEGGLADEVNAVVWGDRDHLDLFFLSGEAPVAWHLLGHDPKDLATHLGMRSINTDAPTRLAVSAVDPALIDSSITDSDAQVVASDHEPMTAAATRTAQRVIGGKTSCWVNLRRDAAAVRDPLRHVQTPLLGSLVAGLIFLATLCGAMAWRGNGYQQNIDDSESHQREVFGQVFPSRAVPVNVKSRLASEHRRAADMGGGMEGLPGGPSCLWVLHDVLTQMPRDLRYRVLELRLTGGQVHLEGQARSHGDADQIATALGAHERLSIDPPRTEALADQGIAFTITGEAYADSVSRARMGGGP